MASGIFWKPSSTADNCASWRNLASLRYELWKLRAKGLVEKLPHSRRYCIPREGYPICLIFLKAFERIYAPSPPVFGFHFRNRTSVPEVSVGTGRECTAKADYREKNVASAVRLKIHCLASGVRKLSLFCTREMLSKYVSRSTWKGQSEPHMSRCFPNA
jgi:hypothetical protein